MPRCMSFHVSVGSRESDRPLDVRLVAQKHAIGVNRTRDLESGGEPSGVYASMTNKCHQGTALQYLLSTVDSKTTNTLVHTLSSYHHHLYEQRRPQS